MEVVYAVVDKVKDKTKSSRGQGQTTDTPRGRQTMNDYYEKDQRTEEDPVYTNTTNIKFKKKEHLATAPINAAGTKNLPSPSSSSQTVDNGRWENDDGLIYVTPFFDVGGQVRRPLHPRKEEADYCTLRMIQTKMSASDEDSDH
ncbi:uncharacterized protein LOC112569259 [Pomacea canaliculata]|nr:uncharacterized protein LOC112569259 [Pomacea canaliculata]